jgi:hypothetical protein
MRRRVKQSNAFEAEADSYVNKCDPYWITEGGAGHMGMCDILHYNKQEVRQKHLLIGFEVSRINY